MPKIVIVVPCYNEAERLDPDGFAPLLAGQDTVMLFVDDGSSDGTYRALTELQGRNSGRVEIIRMEHNQGKAEAVRRGLCQALDTGADIVGYLDADLSTPAAEMLRLIEVMYDSGASAVLGARVQLLGHSIARNPFRHYFGRVFATLASLALRLAVYDTQCGAKLFRGIAAVRQALQTPFASRWAFDVEFIGRLIASAPPAALTADDFLEVPLHTWHHVPGSKLSVRSMMRATFELAPIAWQQRKRRRVRGTVPAAAR